MQSGCVETHRVYILHISLIVFKDAKNVKSKYPGYGCYHLAFLTQFRARVCIIIESGSGAAVNQGYTDEHNRRSVSALIKIKLIRNMNT